MKLDWEVKWGKSVKNWGRRNDKNILYEKKINIEDCVSVANHWIIT